jgi:hypothetical protein
VSPARPWRVLAVLIAAGLLGGCNLVYSERPLFSASDAAGAPALRPGLWARPEADCAFDETKPVADWPDCANGLVFRPDMAFDPKKPGETAAYVLAAGDPRVFQAPFKTGQGEQIGYIYLGVEPAKLDGQGRITAFEAWPAQCGPPPPKPASAKPDAMPTAEGLVTKAPLPGLKLDAKTGMCLADSQEPVRRSAKASRAWADKGPALARWVRDGEN